MAICKTSGFFNGVRMRTRVFPDTLRNSKVCDYPAQNLEAGDPFAVREEDKKTITKRTSTANMTVKICCLFALMV